MLPLFFNGLLSYLVGMKRRTSRCFACKRDNSYFLRYLKNPSIMPLDCFSCFSLKMGLAFHRYVSLDECEALILERKKIISEILLILCQLNLIIEYHNNPK